MSNQREQFEKWAKSLGLDTLSYVYEDRVEYFSISTHYAWRSWLACCELH